MSWDEARDIVWSPPVSNVKSPNGTPEVAFSSGSPLKLGLRVVSANLADFFKAAFLGALGDGGSPAFDPFLVGLAVDEPDSQLGVSLGFRNRVGAKGSTNSVFSVFGPPSVNGVGQLGVRLAFRSRVPELADPCLLALLPMAPTEILLDRPLRAA